MATIEQWNRELEQVKRDYERAAVAMFPNGDRTIYPIIAGDGMATFQQLTDPQNNYNYDHVALIDCGHVMAIWHAQPAPAAPELPEPAIHQEQEFDFSERRGMPAIQGLPESEDERHDRSQVTFDVGDRVRVIHASDVYAGREGVITHHPEHETNYRVKLDLGNNTMSRIYPSDWIELWQPEPEPDALRRERDTAQRQYAALLHEVDILSVSSSLQVHAARQHLMERAREISPETRSLMEANIALQQELESRRRVMNEINDLLYDAQGQPGTFVYNQTSMVDDVKHLIAERDALAADRKRLLALVEDVRKLMIESPRLGIGYDQLRLEALTRIANTLDDEETALNVMLNFNGAEG